jgi:acetyl-CoA acetyltransferase
VREVAIISFAQAKHVHTYPGNEIELLLPVVQEAVKQSGLARERIQFTTLASSDFWAGQAFAFVRALDAAGAYPVIDDSHVDMDGAFALYEAWVRLQTGDVDTALVYALGKSSAGTLHEIAPLGLDPYTLAPLALDPHSVAALSAQAMLQRSLCTEESLAAITLENLARAAQNPYALACAREPLTVMDQLAAVQVASPLRALDCAPVCDGGAALVLASGDVARRVCATPVWIRAIDQRIDAHGLGVRPLHDAPSARLAAERTGVQQFGPEIAELHCLYPHEQVLLSRALGLPSGCAVNPSGSGWGGNAIMAMGLERIIEAARAITGGRARRALAHAAAGPCLQQNLVITLEGTHG